VESNKKKLTPALKITIVFVCIVVLLTFFSKTLYNYNLPTVIAANVTSSTIHMEYTAEGTLLPKETKVYFAPETLKIARVNVSQYDSVKKGDPLVVFDVSGLENTLLDLKTAHEKLVSSRKSAYGREAKRLVDLDIDDSARHIENLEKRIEGCRQITAPYDGVILTIDALAGMTVDGYSPLLEIGNLEKGYQIKQPIPRESSSYFSQSTVIVANRNVNLESEIVSILPSSDSADTMQVILSVDPGKIDVSPGVMVRFTLSGNTPYYPTVIPREALHEDMGTYVYRLVEQTGPLGLEYHVEQVKVTTKDRNPDYVGVTGSLIKNDPVIVHSTQPLTDGQRVVVK